MHPKTAQAFEEIDAAVFSGEMLHVQNDLDQMAMYLSRWTRAMAEDGNTKPTGTAHTPATKLVSMNMNGNLHQVANYVSKFGLSDFFGSPDYCVEGTNVRDSDRVWKPSKHNPQIRMRLRSLPRTMTAI